MAREFLLPRSICRLPGTSDRDMTSKLDRELVEAQAPGASDSECPITQGVPPCKNRYYVDIEVRPSCPDIGTLALATSSLSAASTTTAEFPAPCWCPKMRSCALTRHDALHPGGVCGWPRLGRGALNRCDAADPGS